MYKNKKKNKINLIMLYNELPESNLEIELI